MQSKESIEKQLKLFKKELERAKNNNEYFTVLEMQARIAALNWVLGIYE